MDHNAPEADRRNVPDDVISVSDGELDQESSLGEESSYACDSSASEGKESSDSEPAMSEVSDQCSMLEHAYQSIRNVFSTTSEGKLVGGDGSLNQLESLPGHWPLAKLTLPLKFGVNRLDGLLVGDLMELRATHSDPSRCRRQSSFAKTLTVRVATCLAKEIAALFRPVLYHPLMSLTEDDTLPLLTSEFNVWFPAHWSPIVLRELLAREVTYRKKHNLWFDAPAGASDTDRLISQRSEAVKSRELHFHLGAMDAEKNLPTLIGKLKIDWLDFPVYSSKKQLVRGLVVVQKKRRLLYSSRAIAA